MKNLMIYISPTGSFDNPRDDLASNDAEQCVKVQIDNSLDLGWKREDILLVTNFSYKYRGVKAIEFDDIDFFERKPQVSKINAIIWLFEENLIKGDQLYWFHDLDAFQLEPISESEVDLSNDEVAFTDFGGAKFFMGQERWSGGIIYFRQGSQDIFEKIQELCYEKSIDEEEALGIITAKEKTMGTRVAKLNNSYNFIGYNLEVVYKKSIKPLKVVHFHPLVGKKRFKSKTSLDYFKGDNPLKIPLITDRVVKLLEKHNLG